MRICANARRKGPASAARYVIQFARFRRLSSSAAGSQIEIGPLASIGASQPPALVHAEVSAHIHGNWPGQALLPLPVGRSEPEMSDWSQSAGPQRRVLARSLCASPSQLAQTRPPLLGGGGSIHPSRPLALAAMYLARLLIISRPLARRKSMMYGPGAATDRTISELRNQPYCNSIG